ncbi:MAG: L,D-transpeptidase family protein [Silicimonas sp.]|nr:L,D-transpeptidase family protein [Silicimonas sp.]
MVLTPMGLRFAGRRLPCSIGRGGVTQAKREGDGATPIGTHRIAGMLYRPDRMPRPAPWAVPIRPRDLWCDAPEHPDYNLPVKAPFAASHEVMRRADPLYDLVLVVDWNYPRAMPGAGSAIFLHRWRRPGAQTEGCIAMAPQDLLWLAERIPPGTRLIVPPQP